MPTVRITTEIAAPATVCFDLARSVEVHVDTAGTSHERAVAGVTHGLLGLHDEVTWSARHFFIRQRLTSRITVFDRPHHFRDTMVRGAFARFDHDHVFESTVGGTTMCDVFDYAVPFGWLGRLASRLIVTQYMRRFLHERAMAIKRLAESGDYARYFQAG